jgi:hypothetical protein
VLAWLQARNRPAAAAVTAVLLIPLGLAVYRLAVPWKRADSASAAGYVLARCQATDTVTARDPAYRYYFRRPGPTFTPLEDLSEPVDSRLWILVNSATAEERTRLAHDHIPEGWHVLERREFTLTSVLLLGRSEEAQVSHAEDAATPR